MPLLLRHPLKKNLTLSVPCAPFIFNFFKVCNAMICQPIELESCSNPLRIQQVFNSLLKIFFVLSFGFSEGDVTMRACFCIFVGLLGHWRQLNEPYFWPKFLLEIRPKSASLEPLLDFLSYLEPELWLKNPVFYKNQKVS